LYNPARSREYRFMLHRMAIMVAAIAVGSASVATHALARGGRDHFGGRMGVARIGEVISAAP
jgi:hypothetical protein